MQADDGIGQHNGNYQSLPEPISSAQIISSPPALVDRLVHQTLASDESFLQAANQGPEAAYQQAAGQLHPGAYQQSIAQLHQGSYQSQTVSQPSYSAFSSNLNLSFFALFPEIPSSLFFFFFCFALFFVFVYFHSHPSSITTSFSRARRNLLLPEESSVVCCRRGSSSPVEVLRCGRDPSCSLCLSVRLWQIAPIHQGVSHATRAITRPAVCRRYLRSFPPVQRLRHDSASHLNSPLAPLRLSPPCRHRAAAAPPRLTS